MARTPIRLVVQGYFDGVYFCPSLMPNEKPLLKIKVDGPAIRPGRIPVPLLVQICEQTQKAVNRQAEAMEGRKSLRPGPAAKGVARECTLELIGIKSGSTTLNFAPANDQHTLPELATMRAEAIHGVATTLKSVGRTRGKSLPLDIGILVALDSLGDVLNKGVSKLQLIVPGHNGHRRNTIAEFTPATIPKIKAHLQLPFPGDETPRLSEASLLEGTIEITEGKGRITPLVGPPTSFRFDQEQADKVSHAVHKPAKANVDPKTHKLKAIEVATLPFKSDFFTAKTIDQLIAEQGVKPITEFAAFSGGLSDDEVDALIAEIHQGRQ